MSTKPGAPMPLLMTRVDRSDGSGTWIPVERLADELADIISEAAPGWITHMTHPQAAVVSVRQ